MPRQTLIPALITLLCPLIRLYFLRALRITRIVLPIAIRIKHRDIDHLLHFQDVGHLVVVFVLRLFWEDVLNLFFGAEVVLFNDFAVLVEGLVQLFAHVFVFYGLTELLELLKAFMVNPVERLATTS